MTNSKTRTAPSAKSVYVPGVDFATACSGTKYKNRDDINDICTYEYLC